MHNAPSCGCIKHGNLCSDHCMVHALTSSLDVVRIEHAQCIIHISIPEVMLNFTNQIYDMPSKPGSGM